MPNEQTIDSPEELELGCEQASCNVAADGKCIEGITPITDCPSFRGMRSPVATVVVESDTGGADPASHQSTDNANATGTDLLLYTGEDLVGDAVEAVLRCAPTRVMVLAGSPECGKTTLIASIYERFQKGTYGGYRFTCSRTLPGFERRCFLARTASGRTDPTTGRTQRDRRLRFLHLAVQQEDDQAGAPQNLLFADVHGERFEAAQTSIEEAATLQPLARADHFLLLLDCERLVDRSVRQRERNAGALLLDTLLSAGILGTHSYVDVLFSKWDVVVANGDNESSESFVRHVQKGFEDRFDGKFRRLRFAQIAALPKRGVLPAGYNIENLFKTWVEDSPYLDQDDTAEFDWPTTLREYIRRRLNIEESQ